MRDYKFRGKRLDNGEWVHGYGIVFADDFCIIDQSNELYVEEEYKFRGDTHFFRLSGVMCDPNSVGQFTGLLDKNSKEIYEGDIVKYDYTVKERGGSCKQKAEINYIGFRQSECKFIVVCKNRHHDLHEPYNLRVKVIGNIHDNPELLKHD